MICQAPFLQVNSGQAPQAPNISGLSDDGRLMNQYVHVSTTASSILQVVPVTDNQT